MAAASLAPAVRRSNQLGYDLPAYRDVPQSASLSSDYPSPPPRRVTPSGSSHLLDDSGSRLTFGASSEGGFGSQSGHGHEDYAMGSGGGGLRPRPSKRRAVVPTAVPLTAARGLAEGQASPSLLRMDSRTSMASSAMGSGRKAKKIRSNLEESLLEERLKIANVVLPEDNLEDLMHLPIAPELISRRQRLRELKNPSSTSITSQGAWSPAPSDGWRSPSSRPPESPRLDTLDEHDQPSSSAFPSSAHLHPPSDRNASGSYSNEESYTAGRSPPAGLASTEPSRIPVSPRSRTKALPRASEEGVASPIPLPHAEGQYHPGVGNIVVNSGSDEFGTDAKGEDESARWEVLQAAGGTRALGKGHPPPKSSARAREGQPATPSKRRPSGSANATPTKQTSRPSYPPKSGGAKSPNLGNNSPRPRAATGNLGGKQSVPTTPSGKNAARKVSAPLPSQSAKAPRRHLDPVNGRPRSLSASSAAVDGPLPPWVTDPGPRLYRVNPSADDGAEPRHDDLILPAVARQLEKQRIIEEVEGQGGLITEWDREGNPTKIVRNVSTARRPLAQVQGANMEAASPDPTEGDAQITTPTSEHAVESAGRSSRRDRRDREKDSEIRRKKPTTTAMTPGSVGLTERKEIWQQADLAHPSDAVSEKPGVSTAQKGEGNVKEKDGHGGGCCSCTIM